MDPYSSHANSLSKFKAYLGTACPLFNWDGHDYPIVPSSVRRKKDLEAGGFDLWADLSFLVLVSDLPDPNPGLKQTILYPSGTGPNAPVPRAYRIEEIQELPGGQIKRFVCVDKEQAK